MGNGKSKASIDKRRRSSSSEQSRGDTLSRASRTEKEFIIHRKIDIGDISRAIKTEKSIKEKKDALMVLYKYYVTGTKCPIEQIFNPKDFFIQFAVTIGMTSHNEILLDVVPYLDIKHALEDIWGCRYEPWQKICGDDIISKVIYAAYGNLAYDSELFGEELVQSVRLTYPDGNINHIKYDSSLSHIMTKSYKLTGRELFKVLYESVGDRRSFDIEKFYQLLEGYNSDYMRV